MPSGAQDASANRQIRVLHLLGGQAPFSTSYAIDALGRLEGQQIHFASRTIGRGGDFRNPLAAWSYVNRNAKAIDVVHVWDSTALLAASMSRHPRIVATCPGGDELRRRGRLLLAGGRDRMTMVCQNRRDVRMRAIPWGVEPDETRPAGDPALRRALGLADDDFVVLASGESTRLFNPRLALWVVSILHVFDSRFRLLAWGSGQARGHLQKLAQRLGQPEALRVAEDRLGSSIEFRQLLGAADAAIDTASSDASWLPTALCMAGGLPIVSARGENIDNLPLRHGHNALLVPSRAPRVLAQSLLALRDDTALRQRLGEQARSDARQRLSMQSFRQAYLQLYRHVLGMRMLATGLPDVVDGVTATISNRATSPAFVAGSVNSTEK